jgi:hypothetical protein
MTRNQEHVAQNLRSGWRRLGLWRSSAIKLFGRTFFNDKPVCQCTVDFRLTPLPRAA